MENRITELKARAQALQKVMDEKEETLRGISENIGNMSRDLNDYQIKYESNLKQIPQIKDRLAKKEKIIEQERHDEKIITEKLGSLQKLKVKLIQDVKQFHGYNNKSLLTPLLQQFKLEQKVQKKAPQVQPYNYQSQANSSKIQNYLPQQSQQNQQTLGNTKQLDQHIHQQDKQHKEAPFAVKDNGKEYKEEIKPERKESSNDEEDDKSDEDCDDILKRIQDNLKKEKDDDEEDEEEDEDNDEDNKNEENDDEKEEEGNKEGQNSQKSSQK